MSVFDLEKVKTLFKDFYLLTGTKICIYDQEGKELYYYPEKYSPFCLQFRKDKKMDLKCLECDKKAIEYCKKFKQQYRYHCHAGLLECVSPILYGDTIVGYIVIGQIRSKERNTYITEGKKNGALQKAYEQLPVMDQEKMDAAMNILEACAGYQYLKNLISIETNRLDVRLCEFIDENLESRLDVSILCEKFRLSKTELYELFDQYFSEPVATFIKKRRLKKSCQLLKDTKDSVAKIAKLCGIPDYNYFSKIFKKNYGISPSEYRKKATA